ncbi:enediyne biosynthesis protein UnbU [Actinomadura sp. ATCC 39365]
MAAELSPDQRRIKSLRRFALSITVLTVLGHAWLGFEQAYLTPIVTVLTAYAVELTLESLEALVSRRRPRFLGSAATFADFLLPAHIAGLASAMLLFAGDRLAPYMLAVAVAIATKYVVRIRVHGRLRHVLNPSNTGITVVLLLFPWVGIAPPYQFTEYTPGLWRWVIPLVILAAGTMLNAKLTGKMPLILGWLGGFVLQAVMRAVLTEVWLPSALLPMSGVAFILYTNYMITDPGSTPVAPRRQVAFGLSVAAAYGVLVAAGVSFGLFFALTSVCVTRWLGLAALNLWRRTAPDRRPAPVTAPLEVAAESRNS